MSMPSGSVPARRSKPRIARSSPTGPRSAFGGRAAIVKRARAAEAAVIGQPWIEATLVAAQRALAADYTPLTDLRASAAYRTRAAQNLLRRFWLETRAVDPLPAARLS